MGLGDLSALWVGLVLILFRSTSADSSSVPSIQQPLPLHKDDPGFDLLLLVRTWPPTFCEQLKEQREECTAPPLQEFTLHGLWPEYSSGGWPQYCSETVKEHRNDIDDSKVRCEWPSFHGSTLNFWDHEWEKHGTCAAPLLGNNRTQYFNTVLTLNDKFNLNHVFRSNQLWPVGNAQGMFKSAEAMNTVEQAFGVKPRLACHKGSLAEVWICLDLDLKATECPAKVKPGQMCGNQFRMPPGTAVSSDCQQFYPGEGRNWGQYFHWPEIIGIVVLIGSIISAVLVETKRRQQQRCGNTGDASYEPLAGEA